MNSLANLLNPLFNKQKDDNNNSTVEEKLKVDRKKLEALIDNKDTIFGNADSYFGKIKAEFPAVSISWPMKLKSGTKSKKDPHIRISGPPSLVNLVRLKILETLDPRRDRATLKADIDWTAHSHIIGKSGSSIQAVMDKTGCHVHFPDANRTNDSDKSNQVSISGTPTSVKEARVAIRDHLPVIIWFTLMLKPGNRSVFLDRLNRVIQLIERMTKTQITIRFNAKTYLKPDSPMVTVLVRGILGECNLIKVGTDLLLNFMEDFFIGDDIIYEMNTEIPVHHHSFVLGFEQCNIKSLMATTGTLIIFPDSHHSLKPDIISRLTLAASEEPAATRKTTVNIKGSTVRSVLMAFQLLQSYLPLTLTFDLKEGQEVQTNTIELLSNHYKVSISVKPKPKQNSRTIWIKAAEKDEWKLFQVRRHLVDGSNPISSEPTDSIWSGSDPPNGLNPIHFKPLDDWSPIDSRGDHNTSFDKAPGAGRNGR